MFACWKCCIVCKMQHFVLPYYSFFLCLKGARCVFPGFSEQYAWEEAGAPPEQHLRTTYQQRTKLWYLVEEVLWLELRQRFTDCGLTALFVGLHLVFLDSVQPCLFVFSNGDCLQTSFGPRNSMGGEKKKKRHFKDRTSLGFDWSCKLVTNCFQRASMWSRLWRLRTQ